MQTKVLFEAFNERRIVGNKAPVFSIQPWFVLLQVFARIEKLARMLQQIGYRCEAEELIAVSGVGALLSA